MKRVIIIITLIVILPSSSPAAQVDKRWSEDDLYLFSALISSQIADYTQSVKFNSIVTKNECGMMDTPNIYITENGAIIERWYECTDRQYLRGSEGNPLVRREDGGFDENKALLLGVGLDTSIFYLGTKYPKWRRPLIYIVYAIEIIALQNNHNLGFKSDFPVLPIIFTYNF